MALEFSEEAKLGAEKRFPDGSVDFFLPSDFTLDCSTVVLNDELAKGSYGTVYKATVDGEQYAVKIEDFSDGTEEQVNLLVELTMLQCFPHDRMVRFHGAGYLTKSTGGAKVMILMELCKNGALREALKFNLAWNLRVRMALEIAQGLDFLHGQNVIHRDIKTTNVLIDDTWHAKLCDFSFACHEESTSKREYVYGTDEFMSPEIALAMDFDKSADIFSFGIVLCEMITCREPSEKFLHRQARNMFAIDTEELLGSIQKGCPPGLEALVMQCCDVETQNRPTAQACVEILENILYELGGPDFSFVPATPAKQKIVTALTYANEENREGHVHCPKGAQGIGQPANVKRSTSSSDMDVNSRFAYLEVQIQELRAENRRLNRELHAMMVLYTERDLHDRSRKGSSVTPGAPRRRSSSASASVHPGDAANSNGHSTGTGNGSGNCSGGRSAGGSRGAYTGSSTGGGIASDGGIAGGGSRRLPPKSPKSLLGIASVGEIMDPSQQDIQRPSLLLDPLSMGMMAVSDDSTAATGDATRGAGGNNGSGGMRGGSIGRSVSGSMASSDGLRSASQGGLFDSVEDAYDEQTMIKAAILEAAEQIVLEAAQHWSAINTPQDCLSEVGGFNGVTATATAGAGATGGVVDGQQLADELMDRFAQFEVTGMQPTAERPPLHSVGKPRMSQVPVVPMMPSEVVAAQAKEDNVNSNGSPIVKDRAHSFDSTTPRSTGNMQNLLDRLNSMQDELNMLKAQVALNQAISPARPEKRGKNNDTTTVSSGAAGGGAVGAAGVGAGIGRGDNDNILRSSDSIVEDSTIATLGTADTAFGLHSRLVSRSLTQAVRDKVNGTVNGVKMNNSIGADVDGSKKPLSSSQRRRQQKKRNKERQSMLQNISPSLTSSSDSAATMEDDNDNDNDSSSDMTQSIDGLSADGLLKRISELSDGDPVDTRPRSRSQQSQQNSSLASAERIKERSDDQADATRFRGAPVRPSDVEATPVAFQRPSAASELSSALGRYLSVVKNFSIAALRTSPVSTIDSMPGSASVSMDIDHQSIAADSIPAAMPAAMRSTMGHNLHSSSLSMSSSSASAAGELSEDLLASYSNDSSGSASSSDSIASAWGFTSASASASMASSVDPPFRVPYRRLAPAYGRAPIGALRGLSFASDGNSTVSGISGPGHSYQPQPHMHTHAVPSSNAAFVDLRGAGATAAAATATATAAAPSKISRVTIGGTTSQEIAPPSVTAEVESPEK